MSVRDRLLAVLVAVCWGINFPATAIALEHFPPFLMGALRFTLIAIPTLLLVPRPKGASLDPWSTASGAQGVTGKAEEEAVAVFYGRRRQRSRSRPGRRAADQGSRDVPAVQWRWLIGTGLGLGMLQFAFLYVGMVVGMPSGLASLVLQASAPFTVIIAAVALRERLSGRQVVGVLIAVAGLAAIAVYRAQYAALLPVILTLCAALGWAIGNICSRQAATTEPFRLTLWTSIVPPIPLLILSLIFEGPAKIGQTMITIATPAALPSVLGLLYIVVIATLVGYGLWNNLLSRHRSSEVAPFSMLVPIVGVASSWLAFGEKVEPLVIIAGAAVIAGVWFASRKGRVRALPEVDRVPAA